VKPFTVGAFDISALLIAFRFVRVLLLMFAFYYTLIRNVVYKETYEYLDIILDNFKCEVDNEFSKVPANFSTSVMENECLDQNRHSLSFASFQVQILSLSCLFLSHMFIDV
jgi:hypothetical protein